MIVAMACVVCRTTVGFIVVLDRILVGTLGRGALGEMIEEQGYYDVFILTTWIGLAAAVLVCFEWYRERRGKKAAGIVAPEAGEAVPAK